MEKGKNMFTSFVTEESAAPTGSVQGNALGPDWSTGMNLIGSLDVRRCDLLPWKAIKMFNKVAIWLSAKLFLDVLFVD